MVEERKELEELSSYVGIQLNSIRDFGDRNKAANILEKVVNAFQTGATPKQIKDALSRYVQNWEPDIDYR